MSSLAHNSPTSDHSQAPSAVIHAYLCAQNTCSHSQLCTQKHKHTHAHVLIFTQTNEDTDKYRQYVGHQSNHCLSGSWHLRAHSETGLSKALQQHFTISQTAQTNRRTLKKKKIHFSFHCYIT